MENAEMTKEWFVTHEGKQFGPVSIDDLKFEAERGQLNPRLDMVWRKDMDDWIPAGDLEGLFEKNIAAEAQEKKQAEPPIMSLAPEPTYEEKSVITGKCPGIGRGSFFLICWIFPVLLFFIVGLGLSLLEGTIPQGIRNTIPLILILAILILIIWATLRRFQNLGMSRVWFLGLIVPFLSLWLKYRAFACPPGYAQHKKLDPIGWVLAIIYWIPALAILVAIGGIIYLSASDPEKFKELSSGKEAQQFSEFMEKAQERVEQFRSPKTDEKPALEPEKSPY